MSLLTETLEKAADTLEKARNNTRNKARRIEEIEALYREVKEVYDSEDLSWDQKFQAIFDFAYGKDIWNLSMGQHHFYDHYMDPNVSSHEADVRAFMWGFKNFIKTIKK